MLKTFNPRIQFSSAPGSPDVLEGPTRGGELQGRWFINLGRPGFNSPTNNRLGYISEDAARAALARYSAK